MFISRKVLLKLNLNTDIFIVKWRYPSSLCYVIGTSLCSATYKIYCALGVRWDVLPGSVMSPPDRSTTINTHWSILTNKVCIPTWSWVQSNWLFPMAKSLISNMTKGWRSYGWSTIQMIVDTTNIDICKNNLSEGNARRLALNSALSLYRICNSNLIAYRGNKKQKSEWNIQCPNKTSKWARENRFLFVRLATQPASKCVYIISEVAAYVL